MKTDLTIKIPLFLCDKNGILRLDGLLKLLIEASVNNSEKIEKGSNLNHWIIYRWYVKFYDNILWKDNITIKTSSRKFKGFYAFRNFEVYKNDKKIIDADTKWLLISNKNHRLMKIPEDLIQKYGETSGFELKEKEIVELENYEYEKDILVRKSDLDINNHVNNSVYLEYAIEGTETNRAIDSLQIIYKKEVKYSEDIKLNYTNNENDYYFSINSSDELKTIGHIIYK